jgi:hypothetical protein
MKNTDSLARHYDALAPLERLPLIMAAATRGDEAERDRLIQSAPRQTWSLPDYWGASTALQAVSHYHLLTLLDLAAGYFEMLTAAASQKRKKDDDPLGDDWDIVYLLGYHFKTELAGWRQFCAELNVDPESGWTMLPGFRLVKRAAKMTENDPKTRIPGCAFVAEGVARYWACKAAGNREAEVDEETLKTFWPVTADDVTAALRDTWEGLQEAWE